MDRQMSLGTHCIVTQNLLYDVVNKKFFSPECIILSPYLSNLTAYTMVTFYEYYFNIPHIGDSA